MRQEAAELEFKPELVICGGQTGADIGGVVGAKRSGIATGGTAPKNYMTEKGPQREALIAFGLSEHKSTGYPPRTRKNIVDSNATLIVATKPNSSGTRMTINLCEDLGKPYHLVDPTSFSIFALVNWLNEHQPPVLNIAGNRETQSPGIAKLTANIVHMIFR